MKRFGPDILAAIIALMLIGAIMQDDIADSIFRKAEQQKKGGQFREAIFLYLEALDYQQSRPDIQRGIGDAYIKFYEKEPNDYLLNAALVHFNKAIPLDPQYPYYYVGLGKALELQSQLGLVSADQAYNAYLAAERLDSYNPYIMLQLIRMDMHYNNIRSADARIQKFIRIAPRYFHFAIKYRFRSSDDYYNVTILLGEDADNHFRFANILEAEKYYELSVLEYFKAAQLYSPDDPMIVETAHHLLLFKKYQEVINILERYLAVKPDSHKAFYILGQAYEMTGQLEPAAATLDKAVQYEPTNAEYILVLGRIKERMGDYQTALQLYEKAARMGKKNLNNQIQQMKDKLEKFEKKL